MKHLALSCAIAVLSPLAVNAETATPTNWSGFYGGVSVSKFSGDVTVLSGGVITNQVDMVSETVGGVFAGYNWQNGHWVFGGELAYSNPDQAAVGYPNSLLQDVADVKLRAGYATGKVMFYGVAGLSWSTFVDASTSYDQSGTNYGIGIDYALGKHAVLGLEYLKRDLSGLVAPYTLENDASSISTRLSWKF